MPRRSRAREVALQLLYETDRNANSSVVWGDRFLQDRLRDAALRQFAESLVRGVRDRRAELDQIIQQVAKNWTLSRMTPVDRSILRLACYELVACADTPPKVVMDEAIELAKRYGTADSPRFVNGILDCIHARRDSQDGPLEAEGADGSASPGSFGEISASLP